MPESPKRPGQNGFTNVGQEEDKMQQELQHALTQESIVCQDQLQQALRRHVCQEECADAESHQEMDQLRQLIAQQAEAMKRFESHSQEFATQQHEEWAQKQHTQFQQVDGAARMGSVCAVAQSHTISRLVPVLADNSLLDLTV